MAVCGVLCGCCVPPREVAAVVLALEEDRRGAHSRFRAHTRLPWLHHGCVTIGMLVPCERALALGRTRTHCACVCVSRRLGGAGHHPTAEPPTGQHHRRGAPAGAAAERGPQPPAEDGPVCHRDNVVCDLGRADYWHVRYVGAGFPRRKKRQQRTVASSVCPPPLRCC